MKVNLFRVNNKLVVVTRIWFNKHFRLLRHIILVSKCKSSQLVIVFRIRFRPETLAPKFKM